MRQAARWCGACIGAGGRGADGVPIGFTGGDGRGAVDPPAARQAAFVVAHLTPQEGEDLFRELGNMTPSKSSLERLPKQLSGRWEAERERFEAALRSEETAPPETVTVAVSLDGVMVPMRDGGRTKAPGGPGARQANLRSGGVRGGGVWDGEFYDAEENGSTVRLARMPEKHKARSRIRSAKR